MRNVTKSTLDFYIQDLQKKNKTFILENKRDTNSLYMNNKIVLLNKNQKKRFKEDKAQIKSMVNLFAQVQKSVNEYIKNVDFNIKKIKQEYSSSRNNFQKWNNLEGGEIFYYVDINHCYWRVAFLKGYINKKLYERVLVNPNLKTARNMSLSLIVAPKNRKYYIGGEFKHEIKEDKTIYQTIYNNIRFTSYNLMGNSMDIAKGSFIGYRTDGIMITKRALKKVCQFIDENGFNYTIVECCKVDSKHYLYEGEKKKF